VLQKPVFIIDWKTSMSHLPIARQRCITALIFLKPVFLVILWQSPFIF